MVGGNAPAPQVRFYSSLFHVFERFLSFFCAIKDLAKKSIDREDLLTYSEPTLTFYF